MKNWKKKNLNFGDVEFSMDSEEMIEYFQSERRVLLVDDISFNLEAAKMVVVNY